MRRILVIEDDAAIRRGLEGALRFGGYEPIPCGLGREGLDIARGAALDLVILDVMLPDLSGFDVLAEIRRARPALPVICVTARGAEADRVHGLKQGADDYVVKPFSAHELLARVEAVLRRSAERPLDLDAIEVLGRRIDFRRREVVLADGGVRELTEREADILSYLARSPGRAIARAELLQRLWGLDPTGLHTRTVDMHVARLREKLADDPAAPAVIATVRGKGYKLAPASGARR